MLVKTTNRQAHAGTGVLYGVKITIKTTPDAEDRK
jgi:hypothetical protein